LLYKTFYRAVTRKIFSSSISVGRGGLGIALAKSAIGGMLGIKISLKNISKKLNSDDELLFSESQGRILVSISPYNKKKFEKIFNKLKYYHIGTVTSGNKIEIKGINNKTIIKCNINNLLKSYRKTFKDY
jgi:phosphoribosylformylglycinamidine synthase